MKQQNIHPTLLAITKGNKPREYGDAETMLQVLLLPVTGGREGVGEGVRSVIEMLLRPKMKGVLLSPLGLEATD